MTNAEYLTELVRAHYSGDDRRFSNLLNQVIAAAPPHQKPVSRSFEIRTISRLQLGRQQLNTFRSCAEAIR